MEHITGKKSAANYFLLYKNRNIKEHLLISEGKVRKLRWSKHPSSFCIPIFNLSSSVITLVTIRHGGLYLSSYHLRD